MALTRLRFALHAYLQQSLSIQFCVCLHIKTLSHLKKNIYFGIKLVASDSKCNNKYVFKISCP